MACILSNRLVHTLNSILCSQVSRESLDLILQVLLLPQSCSGSSQAMQTRNLAILSHGVRTFYRISCFSFGKPDNLKGLALQGNQVMLFRACILLLFPHIHYMGHLARLIHDNSLASTSGLHNDFLLLPELLRSDHLVSAQG